MTKYNCIISRIKVYFYKAKIILKNKSLCLALKKDRHSSGMRLLLANGEILRDLLEQDGINQKQLAAALNLAPSTPSNCIRGLREPDFSTLMTPINPVKI